MSKITFRADDELVERLEGLETSKSEVMRDALRVYLDDAERSSGDDSTDADAAEDTLDDALRARIDELVEERIDAALSDRTRGVDRRSPAPPRDVNVNISVDGASDETPVNASETRSEGSPERRKTDEASPTEGVRAGEKSCEKCGESLDADDVYCSNCGEKATHRVFCECGDEVRSDWAFCPGCGRRTSAADVLERS